VPTNLSASTALGLPHQYSNYSMNVHKRKKELDSLTLKHLRGFISLCTQLQWISAYHRRISHFRLDIYSTYPKLIDII
jgi:hypothetical protein